MKNSSEKLNLDMDKVMSDTVSHDDLMQKHLQDKDYQYKLSVSIKNGVVNYLKKIST